MLQDDFWLQLPRTFSNQSSRFELPLDMTQVVVVVVVVVVIVVVVIDVIVIVIIVVVVVVADLFDQAVSGQYYLLKLIGLLLFS